MNNNSVEHSVANKNAPTSLAKKKKKVAPTEQVAVLARYFDLFI